MREHPLVQLTLARMREFVREPEAIFWVFGFPIVMAFALGIAFRNRGPGALLVVPGDPLVYRYDSTRTESRLARLEVDAELQRARGRSDVVAVRDERVTEPGSRYIDFLIPGLLGMNLLGSGIWGVGFAVVQ